MLTDVTFLLFFISHIDRTCIADSGAPTTLLPKNSFFILFICVHIIILTLFCYSFQCFPHCFFTFHHVTADIHNCAIFIFHILQINISSPEMKYILITCIYEYVTWISLQDYSVTFCEICKACMYVSRSISTFCNKSARAKSSFAICVDDRKFCTFCNTSFAYLMMS